MILMSVVVVMKRLPTIIVPIGYQKQVKKTLSGGISLASQLLFPWATIPIYDWGRL